MPVGKVVNDSIHQFPSEHMRMEKLVNPDNYSGDKVVSPVPGVTPNGGEMSAQSELHKVMVRQGPSHHYAGDGEDYGKRRL